MKRRPRVSSKIKNLVSHAAGRIFVTHAQREHVMRLGQECKLPPKYQRIFDERYRPKKS